MPNMRFPSREQVAALREKYPEGTKIELIEMDEEKNPPPGTIGTVIAVDDSGQLVNTPQLKLGACKSSI